MTCWYMDCCFLVSNLWGLISLGGYVLFFKPEGHFLVVSVIEFDPVRLMTSYTILTEELFEFFPEEADMSDP